MDKKIKGFTLIELMIVVVIVAILAAVALPAYQDSVNKGRRTDGQNALLNTAALQERFYSDNGFYGALDVITGGGPATIVSSEGLYNVTVGCPDTIAECAAAQRAQVYTLTAMPDRADSLCGNLTYNQQGVRNASAIADAQQAADSCW